MKIHLTSLLVIAGCVSLATGTKSCRAESWPLPVRVYFIPSGSMEPTLNVGDRMLVDLRAYDARAPRDGELAIFKAPQAALLNSAYPGADIEFIKRVVGTPGQTVQMIKGRLLVNGAPISESYVKWDDDSKANFRNDFRYDMKIVGGQIYMREYFAPGESGPWTKNNVAASDQQRISAAKSEAVPKNQFLVLGDHRSNSNDSHVFGFVPRSAFKGRSLFVFWPLADWKILP